MSGKKASLAVLPDALEYSRFARRMIEADPELAEETGDAAGEPWTRAAMEEFIRARAPADETALSSALRRLRSRVILRTLARDLAGKADLAEVCATMTTLAEVALGAAQSFLESRLHAEFGYPRRRSAHADSSAPGDQQRLIVVGMGKLGGGELNVSSDIDLIFVYPEEGDTSGGRRTVSNHEFFALLGRRLIAMLAQPTADGRVFRVDMRLRPWGDSGPLALSFDALEHYLITQGREWERYAWIKGRALTGGDHEVLTAIMRPFIYRKYLDFGAFAAMRELHREVHAEVARRELADHIKLGPGGIREIEFIVQVFQLIRGGRDASLRSRPTLEVLDLLGRMHLLPEQAVRELSQAYGFLRKLEHRLQYLDDAQTHLLPENGDERILVARSMGYRNRKMFKSALEAHRERVSRHFEQILSTQEAPRHALAPLWAAVRDDETLRRLAAIGFRNPQSVADKLEALRSSSRYLELPESSRMRFDMLVPRIIEHSASGPDPEQTLERCIALIETVSRRAAYLALLDEHPQALAKVVELVGASSWAAEYLVRHPIVLDELLEADALLAEPDWNEFGTTLRKSLMDLRNDPEQQMNLVRESHHAQVFRLLVQDLAGALTVERLADHLSDLADTMLQVVLELCWTQLRTRHREFPAIAIIGYGKLGGKEFGYESDLDIMFVYDDPHEAAAENYTRLAQRINNWLTARTGAGVLFETDLRLRPNGASGLMVSSIEAFRRYQRESAWTWEHQALTRARWCAGEATVGATVEEVRRQILCKPRDAEQLRGEVLAMRKKMLDAHPNRTELFDLKHDRGGMVDIEFIVQYLVLAHSHLHPELTRNDGNIALLRLSARLGLIPSEFAEKVRDAYREYRHRQHVLRLNGAKYARLARGEVQPFIDATLELWRTVLKSRPERRQPET